MFELEINAEEEKNGSRETAQQKENHIKHLHHYLKAKFKQ